MSEPATLVLWHDRDEAWARRLIAALESEGLSIDGQCAAACRDEHAPAIDEALRTAGCVVALWSQASASPEAVFLRDRASAARTRGILIGVTIGAVVLPAAFEGMRLIDLAGWRGARGNPRLRDLVAAVRATQALNHPPGRPGKPPFYRRFWANLTAGGILIGLAGFAMNLFGIQREICAIRSGHVIADACGAIGLGGQPTRSERLAYERLPGGSCEALRRFRPQIQSEVLKEETARRLTAPAMERSGAFLPSPRTWRSYVRASEAPFPTRSAALADALARARDDAAQACAPRDGYERLRGVEVTPLPSQCGPDPRGGFRCSLNYVAQCRIEARLMAERCP